MSTQNPWAVPQSTAAPGSTAAVTTARESSSAVKTQVQSHLSTQDSRGSEIKVGSRPRSSLGQPGRAFGAEVAAVARPESVQQQQQQQGDPSALLQQTVPGMYSVQTSQSLEWVHAATRAARSSILPLSIDLAMSKQSCKYFIASFCRVP